MLFGVKEHLSDHVCPVGGSTHLSGRLGQTGVSRMQDGVASGPGLERLPVVVRSPNGRIV